MQESVFEKLAILIPYLNQVYTTVTNRWHEVGHLDINLRKSLISDVESNDAIYTMIMEYVDFLTKSADCTQMVLDLSSNNDLRITTRIKNMNSIEDKIHRYIHHKAEQGAVPINKCMNDLFGIRIILEGKFSCADVCEYVQKTFDGAYICRDSSKGDYVATHLYFKEGNRSFPWELQIWNSDHARGNFLSHQKYKQDYTTWEQESKEGGIING